MKKHKNIVVRFFSTILRGIKNAIQFILLCILYIFAYPFVKSKVKGKENINKNDEARVFVTNHYEIFGPMTTVFSFPYKFRPWVIDKMMDENQVEQQMGLLIYSQYKKIPRWIKTIVLKSVKSLVVFVMKFFKGIPVSRDNPRSNIETLKVSSQTLEQNKAIVISAEKYYVKEGVGPFMEGFEHIGKYHYQKTRKKISFYPVFISYKNKTMYIGKPITYDPNKEQGSQKKEIVSYIRNAMVNQYFDYEVLKYYGTKKSKK